LAEEEAQPTIHAAAAQAAASTVIRRIEAFIPGNFC
jgi:hypothetical protein